jgi:hypothetical protein
VNAAGHQRVEAASYGAFPVRVRGTGGAGPGEDEVAHGGSQRDARGVHAATLGLLMDGVQGQRGVRCGLGGGRGVAVSLPGDVGQGEIPDGRHASRGPAHSLPQLRQLCGGRSVVVTKVALLQVRDAGLDELA